MSEVPCCPMCGSKIGEEQQTVKLLMGLKMPWMQRSVLRELVEAWPRPLTIEQLIYGIYSGRDEPQHARTNILMTINRLRKSLSGSGWELINLNGNGKGNKALYKMEKSGK